MMILAELLLLLDIWLLCGWFNYQCLYGWSYHLWNIMPPALPKQWEQCQKADAVRSWRKYAYMGGLLMTVVIFIEGDYKYFRRVGT